MCVNLSAEISVVTYIFNEDTHPVTCAIGISNKDCKIEFGGNHQSQAISYTIGFRQSKTALFDWILRVLFLIVSRVEILGFALFLEVVGVREYCCMALENRSSALCLARSS